MAFRYIKHYRLVVNAAEGRLYISKQGLTNLTGINRSKIGALARGKYKNQDRAEVVRALGLPIKGQTLKSRWFDLETVNDILSTADGYDLTDQAFFIKQSLMYCGLTEIIHVFRHVRNRVWLFNQILFIQSNNTNQEAPVFMLVAPGISGAAPQPVENVEESSCTEEEVY